ncbi:hypothetical protein THAOC_03777 [Thalassiosira oceanica]|uniref:Uncharacterized protein n=1 Tax=Thalassiosira oceanica TaxID=159749 RepID=K0TKF1_THAOC|nr:hypothetical protein THAOC_03777 [Thalassiosira oceanica]|eukprot:EJK74541.1 hypothetical protein THAOC_03777 [Thalassiosira oceanica]
MTVLMSREGEVRSAEVKGTVTYTANTDAGSNARISVNKSQYMTKCGGGGEGGSAGAQGGKALPRGTARGCAPLELRGARRVPVHGQLLAGGRGVRERERQHGVRADQARRGRDGRQHPLPPRDHRPARGRQRRRAVQARSRHGHDVLAPRRRERGQSDGEPRVQRAGGRRGRVLPGPDRVHQPEPIVPHRDHGVDGRWIGRGDPEQHDGEGGPGVVYLRVKVIK